MSANNVEQAPVAKQDINGAAPNGAQPASSGQQYPSTGEGVKVAPASTQGASTLQYMQGARRWLLWRQFPEPDPTKKPKKVPYYADGNPREGTLDTPADLARLVSYKEAKEVLNQGGYAGLAFALGRDGDGYWQGIDLDGIEENGLRELAQCAPGYAEVSPSGKGGHFIGYGRRFAPLGSNGSGVEAYSEKRFFTFTESNYRDAPLMCLADFLERQAAPIHGLQRPGSAAPVSAAPVTPSTVTDLRSALNQIPADGYELWYQVGLALSCLGDTGRELWLTWSALSDKYDPSEAAKKWRTFKADDVSYETVFYIAQKHGWVNPRSNEAQSQPVVSSAIRIDTEEPRDVNIEYLQNPWVPEKTVIGCYGRGEAGKSSWAATMGAQISATHSVLWITSEESPDHIKIRHRYCGGDPAALGVVNHAAFDARTNLQGVVGDAKSTLAKPLGLIVLDAVVALVNWKKSGEANDDEAVKKLIAHLQSIAASEGVSILMLGHLNKGKGHDHIADAVLGAAAWTSSVRLAYMFQKVPDEDFTGFVRTAKQNTGIHFGQFYRTKPVYQMAANIDGFRPSLCGIEFIDDRIYGERNLYGAMAEEGDEKAGKIKAKEMKVNNAVNHVLRVLKDGTPKTRKDIESSPGWMEINRRVWQAVDDELERRGVAVQSGGVLNRKCYQLCALPPPS